MDPRDFHVLASRLASAGGGAAEARTAIGRSYYAVFNVGAEWLRQLGFFVGKGAAAHGEVQRCLSNAGQVEVELVASRLNVLHSRRNRADYQLDKRDVEDATEARIVVTQAAGMIAALDGAFRRPHRAQLQASIQNWRKANGYP
jgi:hypothetical protein